MSRTENPKKFADKTQDCRHYCPKCGHSVIIRASYEKLLCSNCKNYIYRNKKDEFLAKIKSEIKRRK